MCGICGELRFDEQAADLSAVQRMTTRLEQRGPDHGGSYSDGSLGFGHRRLSILDLSPAGHQPMSLGPYTIAYNGEVYNYVELRPELEAQGHRFRTHSDTETILRAYEEWDLDFQEQLNGMWAFAVWDTVKRRLFIARDRFGIKPLYYTKTSGRLRFASSLPALLAGRWSDFYLNRDSAPSLPFAHLPVPRCTDLARCPNCPYRVYCFAAEWIQLRANMGERSRVPDQARFAVELKYSGKAGAGQPHRFRHCRVVVLDGQSAAQAEVDPLPGCGNGRRGLPRSGRERRSASMRSSPTSTASSSPDATSR